MKVFHITKHNRGTTEANEKEIIQTNLQKLHVQRKVWRGHNRNVIFWVYFL
jgi:hypothetical protein